MNPPPSPPTSESAALIRTERIISFILRTGVFTSLLVILTGSVISFLHHPGYLWSPNDLPALTTPGQAVPHTLHDMLAGVMAGRGQAIVVLGLLLLIATPVVRVAVSIIAFKIQRDRIFMVITTIVLCLLLISFLLGRAG